MTDTSFLELSLSNVSIINLAGCHVQDENGSQIKMAYLWKYQTIIFIFLRHFGCISCRAHAAQVWLDREKYEKNGAKIVFIGNGNSNYIDFFKEDLKIQGAPVFTDPSLKSFQAAGFKRGFLAALGPKSLMAGIKMFRDGQRQGAYSKETGDLWQMGGVLVVRPNGTVAYHYISQLLGDYPPENDIAD